MRKAEDLSLRENFATKISLRRTGKNDTLCGMKRTNPFFIKGYHGAAYFCDRVAETRRMLAAIENGRDVTLMAPRRYGKTGLIHNVFGKLGNGRVPVYLDIFQIQNLTEFTRAFSSCVVSALATPLERTGKGLLEFFRRCRPTATPQADGRVEFSFNVVPNDAEATLKDTFDFLESRKVEPVVAIDEFQQVREFPEKGVEAKLRSYVQFCTKSHFIFAGSKKHLMEEMFALPRGPFYQSTQLMNVDVIDKDKFSAFAERFFERDGRRFDRESFAYLYDRFGGVTWYLQVVLNRIWERDSGLDSKEAVDDVVEQLVDEGEPTYVDLLLSQTSSSQAVLKAIAAEGAVKEISSKWLIDKYRLPASSTIRSLVRELANRDLIYKSVAGYSICDQLFSVWLRRTAGGVGGGVAQGRLS